MQLWSATPLPLTLIAGPINQFCSPQEAANLGYWSDLEAREIYELLSDIPARQASLGYLTPVLETRTIGGLVRRVAVRYAKGTIIERRMAQARPEWAVADKVVLRTLYTQIVLDENETPDARIRAQYELFKLFTGEA
jgi:hypothetical protein